MIRGKVLLLLILLLLLAVVIFFVVIKKIGISNQKNKKNEFGLSNPESLNKSQIKSKSNLSFNSKTLSEITELVLANESGEELVFSRPNIQSNIKYHEVIGSKGNMAAGKIFQGVVPLIEQKFLLSDLNKIAPEGLFKATVDVSSLSKFKDGTFTTMVRDTNNRLVANAGFQPVEYIAKVSPVALLNVGMQGAAIVSGQYYLEQINSQLTSIDKKVGELIELHHDKELSVLLNTKKRLGEIIKRESVSDVDIHEIRMLRNDVNEVFEHYKLTFERERYSVINNQPNQWRVGKRVNEYLTNIEPLEFYIEVGYQANKLSLQAELAEISVRMKLNATDPLLPELFEQLKRNVNDSLSQNVAKKIELLFEPVHEMAEKIIRDGKDFKIFDKNQKKLLSQITDNTNKIIQQLEKNHESIMLQNFIETQQSKQDVLILFDSQQQNQRVFIPVKN